jgi:hypothetical protein
MTIVYVLLAISPAIVLAIVTAKAIQDFRKESECNKLVDGFMEHIHSGDMEAAKAYWEEHFQQ